MYLNLNTKTVSIWFSLSLYFDDEQRLVLFFQDMGLILGKGNNGAKHSKGRENDSAIEPTLGTNQAEVSQPEGSGRSCSEGMPTDSKPDSQESAVCSVPDEKAKVTTDKVASKIDEASTGNNLQTTMTDVTATSSDVIEITGKEKAFTGLTSQEGATTTDVEDLQIESGSSPIESGSTTKPLKSESSNTKDPKVEGSKPEMGSSLIQGRENFTPEMTSPLHRDDETLVPKAMPASIPNQDTSKPEMTQPASNQDSSRAETDSLRGSRSDTGNEDIGMSVESLVSVGSAESEVEAKKGRKSDSNEDSVEVTRGEPHGDVFREINKELHSIQKSRSRSDILVHQKLEKSGSRSKFLDDVKHKKKEEEKVKKAILEEQEQKEIEEKRKRDDGERKKREEDDEREKERERKKKEREGLDEAHTTTTKLDEIFAPMRESAVYINPDYDPNHREIKGMSEDVRLKKASAADRPKEEKPKKKKNEMYSLPAKPAIFQKPKPKPEPAPEPVQEPEPIPEPEPQVTKLPTPAPEIRVPTPEPIQTSLPVRATPAPKEVTPVPPAPEEEVMQA